MRCVHEPDTLAACCACRTNLCLCLVSWSNQALQCFHLNHSVFDPTYMMHAIQDFLLHWAMLCSVQSFSLSAGDDDGQGDIGLGRVDGPGYLNFNPTLFEDLPVEVGMPGPPPPIFFSGARCDAQPTITSSCTYYHGKERFYCCCDPLGNVLHAPHALMHPCSCIPVPLLLHPCASL